MFNIFLYRKAHILVVPYIKYNKIKVQTNGNVFRTLGTKLFTKYIMRRENTLTTSQLNEIQFRIFALESQRKMVGKMKIIMETREKHYLILSNPSKTKRYLSLVHQENNI